MSTVDLRNVVSKLNITNYTNNNKNTFDVDRQ